MTMPISSAVCWYCRGTASLPMMMMKMNRLSIDREYSVNQPAKNSPPYWAPKCHQTAQPEEHREPDVAREVGGRTPSSSGCADAAR